MSFSFCGSVRLNPRLAPMSRLNIIKCPDVLQGRGHKKDDKPTARRLAGRSSDVGTKKGRIENLHIWPKMLISFGWYVHGSRLNFQLILSIFPYQWRYFMWIECQLPYLHWLRVCLPWPKLLPLQRSENSDLLNKHFKKSLKEKLRKSNLNIHI